MMTHPSLALAAVLAALAACATRAAQDTRPVASTPAAAESTAAGVTSPPVAVAPVLAEPSLAAHAARPGCAQNFGAFDANTDQRVSLEEFLSRPHALPDAEGVFASRDADADGSLTATEFCAGWGTGGGPRMGKGPSPGEPGRGPGMGMVPGMGMGPRKGLGTGMAHGGGRCEQHFARFDANADGNVTDAEFVALPHPHAGTHEVFAARDQNHDGVLTAAEFCSPWAPPSPSP